MAKLVMNQGSTSRMIDVFIMDSTSTTGAGLTGLVFNSAGLTAYYHRENGSASVAITLATMTVGTWATGGFKEIDATNMPGWYQLGLPDTALAFGANYVGVHLRGATNMVPLPLEIQLDVSANANTGTAQAGAAGTITLAAAASATDNLYRREMVRIVSGTGQGQARVITGYVGSTKVATIDENWITNPDSTSVYVITATSNPKLNSSTETMAASVTGAVGSVTGAVGSVTGNVGGNVTGSAGSVTGAVGSVTGNVGGNVVGSVGSIGTNGIAAGSFQTDSITSGALSNGARDEIAGQVWDEARSGHTTAGSFGQGVASVQGNVTGSAASVTGAVGSVTGNVGGNVVGSVGSVTAGVTVTTNNDKTGYRLSTTGVDDVWDEVLSGHLTASTTGAALNGASSAGDPWATALPGAYGSGTAGNIVGNRLDVAVGTRLATSGYTAPPSAPTVASAILATALAELTAGAFPATPTVAQALMLPVHMLARGGTMNKTTGVSTYLNDAGATILKRTDSDDGNVFTEGALVAGP